MDNGRQHKPGKTNTPPLIKSRFRVRMGVAVCILIAAGVVIAQWPVIFVVKQDNGRFLASSYEMREDPPTTPDLQKLRQREHLDQVVAPGKSQFEKIVLLRRWTRQQWETQAPFYYPPWNALEILDLARTHQSRGFCAQYAIVFLQACQAMGIHARYVELPGHFIVGVWSDDYNKWVVMDPMNDVHYEQDGIPLGGVRLLRAYWNKNTTGIYEVKSDWTRKEILPDDIKLYREYSIVKRANHLSDPVDVKVNHGPMFKLRHLEDYRQYPLIGRDDLALASPYLAWQDKSAVENFPDKPKSGDPDDFGYFFNQTMIFVSRRYPSDGRVKLQLEAENSPTFKGFQINLNGAGWQSIDVHKLSWPLKTGMNRLRVRIETNSGWLCTPSEMTIFYKPALLSAWKAKP